MSNIRMGEMRVQTSSSRKLTERVRIKPGRRFSSPNSGAMVGEAAAICG
jgi:hypothetical protein